MVKKRLFVKFFLLFLLTSMVSVLLMTGVMQFVVYRHFSEYLDQLTLKSFDGVVEALGSAYEADGGWDRFRNNPKYWRDFLESHLPAADRPLPRPRPAAPDNVGRPHPDPLPQGGDGRLNDRPSPRGVHPPLRPAIIGRLSLFDAGRQLVFGNPTLDDQVFRAVDVNGQTVGWLGLKKQGRVTNPADIAFLREQARAFYITGGIIILLAIILSLLISRHLLAPIRQLTAGTRALMRRRFDTRIDVATSDELGQLAADFNAMAQTMAAYEQMRRQWLADISHELRTPLAVLRGEIEALQDGIRNVSPETIDSLHAEVLHLSGIVNDLHLISEAESHAMTLKPVPLDPVDILRKTLARFEPRLRQKAISIDDHLSSCAPAPIMGDAERLSQVFANLFENTLRYADSPGTLTLAASQAQDRVHLEIADSGPGVPPSALDRLFDRLYRVDTARTRETGGSGLGLSICKSIVEAHQGTITAENGPSGGLRIMMSFPKGGV